MDSLGEVLRGRVPAEPPEIKLIKQYVEQHFQIAVEVMVRQRDILIMVKSSALASSLRMHSPQIQRACQTSKRLVFRIG